LPLQLHPAVDDVPHPKLGAERADIHRLSAIEMRGLAGDDADSRKARQIRDQVIGNQIGETAVRASTVAVGHGGERQHEYGGNAVGGKRRLINTDIREDPRRSPGRLGRRRRVGSMPRPPQRVARQGHRDDNGDARSDEKAAPARPESRRDSGGRYV